MSLLTIDQALKPWDGSYPLDLGEELTTTEWGWVKRLAGYMPLTVDEGFRGGDPELLCVYAVIVLHRLGKIDQAEVPDLYRRFADAPASTIRFELDKADQEADAGPPTRSSNGSSSPSGDSSSGSSERSEPDPSPTGTPASATSLLAPATSAT